jgi:chromosome segregation ATPase
LTLYANHIKAIRAYSTLINENSRAEYDEYMDSYQALSNMYKTRGEDEESEEAKRRKQERGKRRFEEGFEHVNEEFFTSWQSRTKRGQAKQEYT